MYELEPIFLGIKEETHFNKWIREHGISEIFPQELNDIIKDGDIVVDIGAFIGDYTWSMCKKVGQKGKVYAFEPNPLAFKCLTYNCPKAISYNIALSDKEEILGFYEDKSKNYGASFTSKTFDVQSTNNMYGVIAKPLDSFKLEPRVVKIDVEGFEPYVLRGGFDTFKKWKPILYLEVINDYLVRAGSSIDELQGILSDIGYTNIDSSQQDWIVS